MIRREVYYCAVFIVLCSLFLTSFVVAQDADANTSGAATLGCTPVWACHDWGECDAAGTQHRDCSDLNNCNSVAGIPTLVQQCGATSTEGGSRNGTFSVVDIVLIICGVLFVLILLFILLARRMRRKKSSGADTSAAAATQSTPPATPPTTSPVAAAPATQTILEKAPSTSPQPVVTVQPKPAESNELRSVLR